MDFKEKPGSPEEMLEHFGVKGMRWGHRKAQTSGSSNGVGRKASSALKKTGGVLDDVAFEVSKKSDWVSNHITERATEKLRAELPSIKARHGAYGKLRNRVRHPFSPEAKAYRNDVKQSYLKHLESSANELTNLRGTRQYTLTESGKPNTSQYLWEVSTREVKHAAADSVKVRPIFDSEGWIVDLEYIANDMAQTAELGVQFLTHHGVKGMKWGHRKHATSAERTRSVRLARAESFKQREAFKTAPRGSAQREKAKAAFLRNPDRATALRLTRGEKVTLAILAVAVPGPGTFAAAVTAGSRVAVRKSIERKQARG